MREKQIRFGAREAGRVCWRDAIQPQDVICSNYRSGDRAGDLWSNNRARISVGSSPGTALAYRTDELIGYRRPTTDEFVSRLAIAWCVTANLVVAITLVVRRRRSRRQLNLAMRPTSILLALVVVLGFVS